MKPATVRRLFSSSGARKPLGKAQDFEKLDIFASRPQVLVNLSSVLDVSTGKLAWKTGENSTSSYEMTSPKLAVGTSIPDAGLLQSAQYLHREIPVRLARAMSEMDKIAGTGLTLCRSVRRVRSDYLRSFKDLQSTQYPVNSASLNAFTTTLMEVHTRGESTVLLMARGLQELVRQRSKPREKALTRPAGNEEANIAADLKSVQDFLDSFYQNRVAQRFLCGHFLALYSPPRKGYVGLVRPVTSLRQVASSAASEAAHICTQALGACPQVTLRILEPPQGNQWRGVYPGARGKMRGDEVAAVPEYVHYVLLELIKNAMRVTMETHGPKDRKGGGFRSTGGGGRDGGDDVGVEGGRVPGGGLVFAGVPPVLITVEADGLEDVLVTVSDEGGGISKEDMPKVS
ncbi:unnamed protein product [Discosporangium mesarthrocarpum]